MRERSRGVEENGDAADAAAAVCICEMKNAAGGRAGVVNDIDLFDQRRAK